MRSLINRVFDYAGRKYILKKVRQEFHSQHFSRINERPIEFRFCFECLTETGAVSVLDVGTGKTALPHMLRNCGCVVTAIDNVFDYWPKGMINRHWYVIDDDIRNPRLDGQFDMVTCISVIEHIEEHARAFEGMAKLCRPGGSIVLTTPYTERQAIPNVYDEAGSAYGQNASYKCRSSSRTEIEQWLRVGNVSIARQEYWDFWSGDYWTHGVKNERPLQVGKDSKHQLTCLLFRKNG